MKPWFLKFHRWIALVFALPLACVLASGLILSFEPAVVTGAIVPGSVTAAQIEALVVKHDPEGKARGIAFRSYDRTLTLGGGRGGGTVLDVDSGEVRPSASSLATFFGTTRRFHETLLLDATWLVVASTVAMLTLALIGVLIRWPRFSNTLSGWHMGFSWGLLPLVVLSPLTGLLLSAGITLTGSPPGGATGTRSAQPTLVEAVRAVAREHDLATAVWIRRQGNRMLARLAEQGEYRLYAVTADGVRPLPRNWPRLWHEGNFAGAWSAGLNVLASIAMLGLLVTGPWLWLQRRLRRRRAAAARPRPAAA